MGYGSYFDRGKSRASRRREPPAKRSAPEQSGWRPNPRRSVLSPIARGRGRPRPTAHATWKIPWGSVGAIIAIVVVLGLALDSPFSSGDRASGDSTGSSAPSDRPREAAADRAEKQRTPSVDLRCPLDAGSDHRLRPGKRKLVALTFDDGPSEHTAKVLDILKSRDAKATFFITGRAVPGKEKLMTRAAEEGHDVGNHTENHLDLTYQPSENVVGEIDATEKKIRAATGRTPCIMRPPFGKIDAGLQEILKKEGYASIRWSVESNDYFHKDPASIVSELKAALHPGAIVLMHDGGGDRAATVQALPKVLDLLESKGYRAVAISTLFAPKPKKRTGPQAGVSARYPADESR